MSTRRISLTREHVDALNLIETEFYGHEKVQAAFRDYIGHLSTEMADSGKWHDTRNNKLATLLHQLSLSVGMPIGEIDIRTGGYSPSGWERREVAEQYILGLANGTRTVPVEITNLPPSNPAPSQSFDNPPTVMETPGMRIPAQSPEPTRGPRSTS